jgi:RNA-binding protein 39
MFTPDEATDPQYLMDLKEEVEEECKSYGEVEHVLIDQNR